MAAELRWNPRKRIITLTISGTYTLDEFRGVNEGLGEICTRDDFEYGYLLVDPSTVQRPSFSPLEGLKHTNHFRDHDLRLMVVYGLSRTYQFFGGTFRLVIENAVGMPLLFVDTREDALRVVAQREAAVRG